ncbi:unnamed protein product [Strongylus vulgaris]|uniref:Uncharacterized protein n=1 Tax=Strongylus vulgaris TaxID=40348 RepID=A0A3P7KCU3_STRVU|nr:unnamed protein product [Strongylus vulgaris]
MVMEVSGARETVDKAVKVFYFDGYLSILITFVVKRDGML